jgi:hypothetical protein
MDQAVDALGPQHLDPTLLTRDLLAETDDPELQHIVAQVAERLAAPIALVSLLLDQVQFFKAHYGLPPVLQMARATSRDVSFCQFVVRDGVCFEVNDAAQDTRVPQHLVETYGISSYLGVPVRIGEQVVGSLCAIDTKTRAFTPEERRGLEELAELAQARLTALTESRHRTRTALTAALTGPALLELSAALAPIQHAVDVSRPSLAAIRAFLRHAAHTCRADGTATDPALERTLNAAEQALLVSEDALYDIEAAVGDGGDCVVALERLQTPTPSTKLSEVAEAAQDLARPTTRRVGGASLPEIVVDSAVYAPRPLAVSLLAACTTFVASILAEHERTSGIVVDVRAACDRRCEGVRRPARRADRR